MLCIAVPAREQAREHRSEAPGEYESPGACAWSSVMFSSIREPSSGPLPHHRQPPLVCTAGHGSDCGSVPAVPRNCVGQFYASDGLVHKPFPPTFQSISAVHRVAHRLWVFAHRTPGVVHMFSTSDDGRIGQNRCETVWIVRPTSPPTTVPLMRMNCRSRPTCSSMRSAVSLPSHRFTVTEMTVAISVP